MRREEMREWLLDLDLKHTFPIWVISYNRAGEAPLLNKVRKWSTPVNVFVRESQAAAYRDAYPTMTVYAASDETIDNCGKARWVASELAYALGHDIVIMMDDDVLDLRFLFQREFMRGKNVGKECSGHSTLDDWEFISDLEERVLAGIASVARDVFSEHPNAMLGGPIKQHMSFSHRNHRTKYVLNGGVTPRQCTVWHLDRMFDAGVVLDTDRFGVHGEDLGLVDQVLRNDGDCWAMPSFAYEHWPESINITKSTIRHEGNARSLHEYEYEMLMQCPIKDYLRIKRSVIDGSYEWGDVNWPKLHKIRGTKQVKVGWDPELPPDGPELELI